MVDRATIPLSAPSAPAAAPANVNVTVKAQPGLADRKGSLGGTVIATRPETPAPAPAPAVPEAPSAPGPRPTWLPEKFKSPEDLSRAYAELEQRLGSAPAAPAPEAAPAAEPAPAAPVGAAEIAGRMTQEYASSGQVSQALRQEFVEKTGLEERFIDNQIAYLRAQGARASEMAVQRLGGDGAVKELMDWAGKRLSEGERQAFNRAVYSGDEAMARFAVDGLAAKYEMEVGRSPRVMAGRKPQDQYGGITPYQSHEEWRSAMKDPRYKKDPAYRQEVEDRLRTAIRLGLIPA